MTQKRNKITVQCEHCGTKFDKPKFRVNESRKYGWKILCSRKCMSNSRTVESLEFQCANCGTTIHKKPGETKKNTSGRFFCSQSCSGTYNNTHRKHGTRRSKLELWLEDQLTSQYSNIDMHFNQKDTIHSELDIYIPSLKLAFELNGIFHYEPIFGDNKLSQIQNNDNRKFQACLEKGIELCIIDTSQQKYFKPKSSQRFLDIICNIIDTKLSG